MYCFLKWIKFSQNKQILKKYWKIGKNTGKVREKSGNFVSPEKWEPWSSEANEKHSWEIMMEHFTVIMLKINSEYLLVWLAYSTEVTF